MNTLAQNQKVVKGLSIAAIVISALAIIFSLVMVFTASATLAYVNETIEEYSSLSSYYSSYYYGYVDPDELAAMSFAATAMVALAVFAVISGGFQLFVSIFIFLKHKDTTKLKTLFVLAIIAAVASLVVGGIVNIVLFVLMAVFIYKMRKAIAPAPAAMNVAAAPAQTPVAAAAPAAAAAAPVAATPGTRSSRAGSSTSSYASSGDPCSWQPLRPFRQHLPLLVQHPLLLLHLHPPKRLRRAFLLKRCRRSRLSSTLS